MKQQLFKLLTVIAFMLFCINVSAYDFEVDGIYYNITSFNDKTVEVTVGDVNYSYSGNIVIPSSVQYQNYKFCVSGITSGAFNSCSSLESITIPNSVTGILYFRNCSSLRSISIPNSVTVIGGCAFVNCSSLTSIIIPNSVTTIEDGTFMGCSSLASITIPNSVTTIITAAFDDCPNLMQINCDAIIPPNIKIDCFTLNQKLFAQLNVPEGSGAAYRAAECWKDFVNIVENGKPVEPAKKCEAPTISYVAGKLKFSCNTEGAEYHYTLTDSDVKNDAAYSDGTVSLDACYKITAYATADGYMQSEKATATLYWINANLETTNIN